MVKRIISILLILTLLTSCGLYRRGPVVKQGGARMNTKHHHKTASAKRHKIKRKFK